MCTSILYFWFSSGKIVYSKEKKKTNPTNSYKISCYSLDFRKPYSLFLLLLESVSEKLNYLANFITREGIRH